MSALCVGKSWLFDSTDIRDHEQAAKLCAACPVREWCREQAAALSQPVGTWAGVRYGATTLSSRMAIEDAMFSDDDARAAHAAWFRGVRDDRTHIGERVYQRRVRRTRRAA